MSTPPKMVEVQVARGRTLVTPGTPIETKDGDKVVMSYRAGRTHAAGSKVRVSSEDVPMLTAHGFIFDPDAAPANYGEGPNFSASDGPSFLPR